MILNPTCGNFKTQQTLVESGVGLDGCVGGEGDNESTQVLSSGGSKSIFYSLGSFNNYMDHILTNLDPLSSQVDKHGHFTYYILSILCHVTPHEFSTDLLPLPFFLLM